MTILGLCPWCGDPVVEGQTAGGHLFCYCGWTAGASAEAHEAFLARREAERRALRQLADLLSPDALAHLTDALS